MNTLLDDFVVNKAKRFDIEVRVRALRNTTSPRPHNGATCLALIESGGDMFLGDKISLKGNPTEQDVLNLIERKTQYKTNELIYAFVYRDPETNRLRVKRDDIENGLLMGVIYMTLERVARFYNCPEPTENIQKLIKLRFMEEVDQYGYFANKEAYGFELTSFSGARLYIENGILGKELLNCRVYQALTICINRLSFATSI